MALVNSTCARVAACLLLHVVAIPAQMAPGLIRGESALICGGQCGPQPRRLSEANVFLPANADGSTWWRASQKVWQMSDRSLLSHQLGSYTDNAFNGKVCAPHKIFLADETNFGDRAQNCWMSNDAWTEMERRFTQALVDAGNQYMCLETLWNGAQIGTAEGILDVPMQGCDDTMMGKIWIKQRDPSKGFLTQGWGLIPQADGALVFMICTELPRNRDIYLTWGPGTGDTKTTIVVYDEQWVPKENIILEQFHSDPNVDWKMVCQPVTIHFLAVWGRTHVRILSAARKMAYTDRPVFFNGRGPVTLAEMTTKGERIAKYEVQNAPCIWNKTKYGVNTTITADVNLPYSGSCQFGLPTTTTVAVPTTLSTTSTVQNAITEWAANPTGDTVTKLMEAITFEATKAAERSTPAWTFTAKPETSTTTTTESTTTTTTQGPVRPAASSGTPLTSLGPGGIPLWGFIAMGVFLFVMISAITTCIVTLCSKRGLVDSSAPPSSA